MGEQCPYCNNPDLYQIPHSGESVPLACRMCGWEGLEEETSQWGENS